MERELGGRGSINATVKKRVKRQEARQVVDEMLVEQVPNGDVECFAAECGVLEDMR